jgi:two-component system, NarL family, sensor histidine kinase BarA
MTENIISVEPSIDWNLSVKLANNNADLAKDLLDMFVTDLPLASEAIHAAHNSHEHIDLLNQVHKLNGASCYCGVTHLKHLLSKMESSLKEKQYHQFDEFLSEFDQEVNSILSAYKFVDFV